MTGYGARIYKGFIAYQAVHGRTSATAVGELVARIEGREKPYHKVTVGDWMAERSPPSLAAFMAIAQLFGGSPGWYAFGEGLAPMNIVAAHTTPVAKSATKKKRGTR